MKTIYLEPDEEIISVIDRLGQIDSQQINLVVPFGAQIWQSSINLKLLKREIDNLNKEIILVIPNDLDSEAAEKIGFIVKREGDFSAELVQEKEEDYSIELADDEVKNVDNKKPKKKTRERNDMIDALVNEMQPKQTTNDLFDDVDVSNTRNPLAEKLSLTNDDINKENKPNIYVTSARRSRKSGLSKLPSLFTKKNPSRGKTATMTNKKAIQKLESSVKWNKIFILFLSLAVVVAGLVIYFVLPTTKITIYPKAETLSFSLLVEGSKDITQVDTDLNEMPLEEIKAEETLTRRFKATGEKELNQKAKGIMTVFNEYSSVPQILVATTRFESPDGKIFRIQKNITIPGAKIENSKIIPSSIDVEVVADQPGEDYNIGPTEFTIPGFKGSPKYVGFYGKTNESMDGGAVGKMKVVLTEDLKKAEEELKQELGDELKLALQEQVPNGFNLIEEGIEEEVLDFISDVEADEPADDFNLELSMEARGFLYNEDDLKAIINSYLDSEMADEKEFIPESQIIEWEDIDIDWLEGKASLSLLVKENVAWKINLDELKQELVGKKEVDVRKYLTSQPKIEKASLEFWPFWVKRASYQNDRIELVIAHNK